MNRKRILCWAVFAAAALGVGIWAVALGGRTAEAQARRDAAANASVPSGALVRYPNNPIVPMGPAGSIDDDKTGPRVVLKDGPTSYRMWYEAVPAPNASTVGYAVSTDGRTWTKQGSVLSPSAPWEGGPNGEVSPNTILVENGVYKMWYHSFNPADGKRRIGYATSPNGLVWTKNPNPVLDVGPAGAFDDYMVTEPRVFNLGNGQYRMYYGGMRQSEQGLYRLMMATSADGVNWTRSNQVYFGPTLGAGYAVVRDAGQWHMWFDQNFNTLNYASSSDGLVWTPGPNNPVLVINPNPAAVDSGGVGDSVSAYRDGNEFRVMYTGGRYNSFGRNESICLATITVPACALTINASAQNYTAAGGAGALGVTTGDGCGWTAATTASWITINSGGGSGSGAVTFTVRPNTGAARTGTITVGGQVLTVVQAAAAVSRQKAAFDFDGDEKTDIGVFRPAANAEWWLLKSATGAAEAVRFGTAGDRLVPADYTGDGRADPAVWRAATGSWFVLRSEDGSFYSFQFGTAGDVPAAGDFDGDGKSDPAVFRPSNGTWYIANSAGGVAIRQFGAAGDAPAVGDYDGDGKSDIAVFRANGAAGAEWWLAQSANGLLALQFGGAADKPVAADFTGDGRTDVAFFRPATGSWFVLRSENFSFYAFPFGAAGDAPVVGDYDGDGRADAAVFRPASATWYLNRSTAGGFIAPFGAAGDLAVANAFVP